MRTIGWLPISVPNSLDGINNPRPIIVKAVTQGKTAILHFIDAYGKSICKKCIYMVRVIDHNGINTAIEDVDNMSEKQKEYYMPCPDCYMMWKDGKWKENDS